MFCLGAQCGGDLVVLLEVFVDQVQVAGVVVAPLAGRRGAAIGARGGDAGPPVGDRVFECLQPLEPIRLGDPDALMLVIHGELAPLLLESGVAAWFAVPVAGPAWTQVASVDGCRAARNSARSSVMTVCGFRPGCLLRAT
jgi:hypothetical protein